MLYKESLKKKDENVHRFAVREELLERGREIEKDREGIEKERDRDREREREREREKRKKD